MFDTIKVLPEHAMVIHDTDVLVPLIALVTVVVAVRGRLRTAYPWWVAGLDALLVPLVLVTKLSGEKLQARLGGQVAIEHGRLGSSLVWFTVGLLAAAVLMAGTRDRPGPVRHLASSVVVVAAVAVVLWTVRVGDSGARALWGGLPGG